MSLGARIAIALFATLIGVLMAEIAPDGEKALPFYAFAAFCISISIASLTPGRISQLFGSLGAAGVLGVGLLYFTSMLLDGPIFTGRSSDQSLVNAVLFLFVFGTPSVLYLWHARFGIGRKSPT